jgi:putative hydrolase of the HAD superfamily
VLRVVLARAGILDAFDQLTFSDEVCLAKPNPAIFLRTVAALGVPPESAIHVGDDPGLDIDGALAAGMGAIQVTAHAKVSADEPRATTIDNLDDLLAVVDRITSIP